MSITDTTNADELVEMRDEPHQWEYDATSERNSLYSGKSGIEGVKCMDCPAEGFRTFELVPNHWNSSNNPDDFRPPYLRKVGPTKVTSGHIDCPGYDLRATLEATLVANGIGYVCVVALVIGGAALLYVYRRVAIDHLPARFWFALCPIPFMLSVLHGFIGTGHRELKRVRLEMAKVRAGWVPVKIAYKEEKTFGHTPSPRGFDVPGKDDANF